MGEAREGQTAVELACGCDETTLVRADFVADWKCGKCRKTGKRTGHTVVLGIDGALPAGWRDELVEEGAVA